MGQGIVAGLIFNKEKLLLIYHKRMNLWMSVAGHIEEGESNRQALKREIKEEVNLSVEIAKKPFYIMKESKGKKNTPHFICKMIGGKLKLKLDEVTNYRWFSREELEKSNLDKLVKKIALKAFEKYLS